MRINEILQGEADTLLIVRRNDLIDFAKAYAQEAGKTLPEPDQGPEAPISQNEAIKFLGISRQALYSWRRQGNITAHVIGRRLFYFKSELLEAMKRASR